MEQCPENGEEGLNTVFPRLANIDTKPNQGLLCLTNTLNVFALRTLLKMFRLFAKGIHEGAVQIIMSFKNEETEVLFASGNFPPLNTTQRKGLCMLPYSACNRSAQFAPNSLRQQAGKVEGRSGRSIQHRH
jgi:hypothetical protein